MKKHLFPVIATVALLAVSCTTNSKGAYKHVVILGVDGAGAWFSETTSPNTFAISSEGTCAYDVVTSFPTISGQCWGSMLHGVLPEDHKLTNDIVSTVPYDVESPYPSIFRVIREARPDAPLASFSHWNPINFGIVENNLGVVEGTGSDPEVTDQILSYLEGNAPTLLFIQFDSVDGAGHANGYGTPNHLSAITAVDGMIGQIYDAYKRKGILDDTLFIITADHGGTPNGSHGGDTPEERIVFLGIHGKTIAAGGTITGAEIRDIPAIAAYALGLDDPETWTGKVPAGIFPEIR